MNAAELYLRRLQDLEKHLSDDGEYDTLQASAILRQLLLDGLINDANRTLRLKLAFQICEPARPSSRPAVLEWPTIDPSGDPHGTHLTVKLDGLLATQCALLRGTAISIKDILRVYANVRGGVHLSSRPIAGMIQPTEVADGLDNAALRGIPVSRQTIKELGRVVLQGLLPLTNVIRSNE